MNTLSKLIIISLAAFSAASCSSPKAYTVKITGEGLDFYPDSSRMLVFHDGADYRFDKPVADGYITDGCFSLSFMDSITRVYDMVVESDIHKGSFMTFPFFSDRESLHFSFSRKYGEPCTEVTGSSDNEELYLYRKKYSETYEAIDSMYYELDRWRIAGYGEEGWPEEGSLDYAFMAAGFDSINAVHARITEESEYDKWLDDRLRNHKSLAGLLEISRDIRNNISDMVHSGQSSPDSALLGLYMEYREVYPDSWLVQQTDAALSALDRLAPGMPYPDFEAPSADGNRYTLSELIGDRIAVLDCWASWCRPCRKHSKELIPLYEKYKDKGFTVIGVAREYGNLKDMEHAVKTDGYPWIQLYDLDGAEGIWDLYGLSTAGGGIFLIGKDGKIVEKVLDINSVKSYLEEHLGK